MTLWTPQVQRWCAMMIHRAGHHHSSFWLFLLSCLIVKLCFHTSHISFFVIVWLSSSLCHVCVIVVLLPCPFQFGPGVNHSGFQCTFCLCFRSTFWSLILYAGFLFTKPVHYHVLSPVSACSIFFICIWVLFLNCNRNNHGRSTFCMLNYMLGGSVVGWSSSSITLLTVTLAAGGLAPEFGAARSVRSCSSLGVDSLGPVGRGDSGGARGRLLMRARWDLRPHSCPVSQVTPRHITACSPNKRGRAGRASWAKSSHAGKSCLPLMALKYTYAPFLAPGTGRVFSQS